MKLFELSEQNVVAVYTDDSYDEEALANMILVFNVNKAQLKNYIKEMLIEYFDGENGDEYYVDVVRNIDAAEALEKFLKKKNIKSIRIQSFADKGLSMVDIAENMPDPSKIKIK